MTPDATATAPNVPESPAKWVSVSQAVALLGISEKTVRKRIASGQLEAKRVPQKRGGISYLVALETEAETELLEAETEAERKPASVKAQTETEVLRAERKRDGTRNGSGTELEMLREQLLRERELNAFFRLQIEEGNRNAAELRSALRKSLDNAPRQLTVGSAASETQAAPEAPKRAANRAGEGLGLGGAASNEAQNGEVSSYSSIADWLENEILER